MKPKIKSLLVLLYCGTLIFLQGCGIVQNDRACNGEFSIYWKMGQEWRSGGGLGTITIRDNLRLTYVGSVIGDFAPPVDGAESYCFEGQNTEGGEGEICIPMGNCNFFVTNAQNEQTMIYAPEECVEGQGIPQGPGNVTN